MADGSERPLAVQALKRLIEAGGLLLGVIAVSFLLFSVLPGDSARIILGPNASVEAVEELRRTLGTDRPLAQQFATHLRNLATLDLGRSIIDGRSVGVELVGRFRVSATLGVLAGLMALGVSYATNLTVFLSPRLTPLYHLTRLGVVTPTYCTGVLAALLFGVLFPVVPLGGFGAADTPWALWCLPAAVAALYPAALMTGILREKIREAGASPFARAAAAAGAAPVRLFHATILPVVAVSWLSVSVNQISLIFVAAFVLEVIFTIPGVGLLLIRTVQQKDLPMLQGIVLLNAAFFIALSWLSETLFDWLDPRRSLHAAA